MTEKTDFQERCKKLSLALAELEGFARRNEERARKACAAVEADQWGQVKDRRGHHDRKVEAYGRLHEAVRFHQVVRDRVREALS